MSEWNNAIEAAAHEAEIWDSEPLSGASIAQQIRKLARAATVEQATPAAPVAWIWKDDLRMVQEQGYADTVIEREAGHIGRVPVYTRAEAEKVGVSVDWGDGQKAAWPVPDSLDLYAAASAKAASEWLPKYPTLEKCAHCGKQKVAASEQRGGSDERDDIDKLDDDEDRHHEH